MQTLLSVPPNVTPVFNQLKNRPNTFVTHDPVNKRLGSGGGTAYLINEAFIASQEKVLASWLSTEKRCIIHGGGQSRRVPAYGACSKLLTPIPVHRWSRGQRIDQTLLDLQIPLFQKLLQNSNQQQSYLIASGDVLIHTTDQIEAIPEVDIVCVGLWSELEVASRHGVFFCDKQSGNDLSFMLQKPPIAEIQNLAEQYHFLIDAGVWLLSERAIKVLLKKCGWQEGQVFNIDSMKNYDLYSEFGPAMGKNAVKNDSDINALTSKVLILDQAQFLHYGTSQELISSSQYLQNSTFNQRKLMNAHGKKHSDVFVQNVVGDFKVADKHHNIWIENAWIPKSWTLSQDHVITNIPPNNWQINLPKGICLEIIPLQCGDVCIRPYGIRDKFGKEQHTWLNTKLDETFRQKGFQSAQCAISKPINDLQETPLFPVLPLENITQEFLQWLIDGTKNQEQNISLWKQIRKLSAAEIQLEADLVAAQQQRIKYLKQSLPLMAKNYKKSVFYQLDLKEMVKNYPEDQLPDPVPNDAPLSVRINDAMFRSEVLKENQGTERLWESKAFSALRNEVLLRSPKDLHPHYTILDDQIIWGRSPARLDLAGGWSDTPPLCFFNGGKVVNVAVNLNGQPPIQVFARKLTEHKVVIRSIDLGLKQEITDYQELMNYNQVGAGFVIPKAALVLCGIHSNAGFVSLKEQLIALGGGLEVTMLAAIPKGSGLGTSSILAATVIGVFNKLLNLKWDQMTVCSHTLILEQMLTTGGGWQDQFGGIYRGLKLFETTPGIQQQPSCKWLPEQLFEAPGYASRILLYYTGITRVAKNILSEIVRGMFLNSQQHLDTVGEITNNAHRIYDTILKDDFEGMATCIERSWELNQRLDSGTKPEAISKMLEPIEHLLSGKKLLGAGGGGYMFMIAKSAKDAQKVKEILTLKPPAPNARFVDMAVSQTGLEITTS
ncbi:MAG: bifunctional fucokinase/L-fucose-1-P-guanylyltransferase [Lentisphaeria bacterium]|nr:bifunctional fucokinase/L-fucose-1-P-guanylyltransferase [Lentisphaeria bacterium]